MPTWQKNLFYLVFFLLPVYLVKIPLGKGSINLLDLLIIICLFLFFRKKFFRKQLFEFFQKNQLIFLAFFLLFFGTVSSLIVNFLLFENYPLFDALGAIKSFLVLPIIFSLTIAILIKNNYLEKEKIFNSIFLLTGFLSFLGAVYYLKNILTFDGRLQLFFESPNHLAMILALGVLIGIWKLNYLHSESIKTPLVPLAYRTGRLSKRGELQLFFSLFLLLHFFVLWHTQSAGAWLGLILASSFSFFSQRNRGLLFSRIILSFLGLFGILSILVFPLFLQKTAYSPTVPPTSLDSRIAIYSATRKIILDHPFFGVGSENFQSTYLTYQQFFPPYPQWAVPHPHNLFFHFWTISGLTGLAGFILLLFLLFPKQKTATCLAVSIVAYFIVHGLVDVTIWKNDLAIVFWISLLLLKDNAV